ncbi:MAG: CBS domain-containing protein [Deltaproteobacteria bacterium]|nr:MAG: CBS domain-containing protein [Deltaproteobacteria bacterium]
MKVSDYMTPEVITANLKDGLHQTFTRMRERNIRHMPVLDTEEKIVGIISDRDLRRPRWLDGDPNQAQNYQMSNDLKVEAAMSSTPDVVQQGDTIKDAVSLFVTHKYGALPVVDNHESRKVVGMLSLRDLMKAFNDSLQ